MSETRYVYYSVLRPVDIGTYPKNGMVRFHNYDTRITLADGTQAWGYLEYDRELELHEVTGYDLKFAGIKEVVE